LPITGDSPGRKGAFSAMAGANSVDRDGSVSTPETYTIPRAYVAPAATS
jgi:hypothetical protein